MEASKKFSLNEIDWQKIGKWAMIAAGGALFTYLQQIIVGFDFGVYTPIVMAMNSVLVNAVNKFLEGNR